nr:nitrous oxide reductase accessory protein NosL [bacterium]
VVASGSNEPDVAAADTSDAHQSCPYCGMFGDKSRSAVAVMWVGGGSNTFDSFDCLFNYMKDNNVQLQSATVKNYVVKGKPEWIDAPAATFLFGTTTVVEGSMEPYVAAFATRDLAQNAMKDMGGEVVDFAALENKWRVKE